MAHRKQAASQESYNSSPKLVITIEDAQNRIEERIKKGEKILEENPRSEQELETWRRTWKTWDDFNIELLTRIFESDKYTVDYRSSITMTFGGDDTPYEEMENEKNWIRGYIRFLGSLIERLPLIGTVSQVMGSTPSVHEKANSRGNKIFLVHGHDEAIKHSVARFVQQLGLESIILSEQANFGSTIIEKFESNAAEASFAIIILTPDDVVSSLKQQDATKHRARQNVIFEWGYFVGSLGRKRVVALHAPGVELPSDLHGVVYVPLDAGEGWKIAIAKELKAGGFSIDFNSLF